MYEGKLFYNLCLLLPFDIIMTRYPVIQTASLHIVIAFLLAVNTL